MTKGKDFSFGSIAIDDELNEQTGDVLAANPAYQLDRPVRAKPRWRE